MKNLLLFFTLLGLPLGLSGQAAHPDSLAQWLGAYAPAIQYGRLESLRARVEARADLSERYAYARGLMLYGRDRADTLAWQFGLAWLDATLRGNDELEKAEQARQAYRELAVAYGLSLDRPHRQVNEPFGYRYHRVDQALALLEDATDELDFEDILERAAAGHFALNESAERGFRPDLTYWIKLRLRGKAQARGSFTLVPASGYGPEGQLLTWDSIAAYIFHGPDSLVEQHTGRARRAAERPVRDAYPFVTVDLGPGEEATLFLRLRGGQDHPASRTVFLEAIDRESLHEWDGYRLPARTEAAFPEGAAPRVRRIARSLEVLIDDTEELGIGNVWGEWAERGRVNDWWIEDWQQIFWVRLRLLGSDAGAGPLLLRLPPDQPWDSVEVYWPNAQHRYVRQWIGRSTPLWKRPLPHWQNLLRLDLLPTDTMEVLFRLRGYHGDPAARQIRLEQVLEDSFWPGQPYPAYFRGALVGILGILLLYTLVLALVRFRLVMIWLGLFLAGLLLVALCWFPEHSAALVWPGGVGYFDYLALGGVWLALSALTRFFVHLLAMPKLSRAMVRWANYTLVLWTLAILYLLGTWSGLVPAWLTWTDAARYLILAFASLLFVTGLVLSLFAINQGAERGWMVLIALVFAAIAAILSGAQVLIFGEMALEEPVLWISLGAGSLSLLFLLLADRRISED